MYNSWGRKGVLNLKVFALLNGELRNANEGTEQRKYIRGKLIPIFFANPFK